MEYTLDDSPQRNDRKRKNKGMAAVANLLSFGAMIEGQNAQMAMARRSEMDTSYSSCGMTGKAWNRKKSRRKLARKARRGNR